MFPRMKRQLQFFVIAVVVFTALSGCLYRRMWLPGDGGYDEREIAPATFEVTFRGPVFFSHEQCLQYAKRRAAELTLERGFTHYQILSTSSETDSHFSASTPNVRLKSNGRGGYDSEYESDYGGGMYYDYPVAILMVKLGNGPAGIRSQ